MKAVIMAGGIGSRLRPLTDNLPKPMVNIINKPILEYIIEHLKKYNITDIAITLYYRPEVIMNYFKNGSKWGVNIKYFIENKPLGTAGSVKQAEAFLDDDFVVISGDAFTDINLEKLITCHKKSSQLVTMAVKRVQDAKRFGVVVSDSNNRVISFVEKPQNIGEADVNMGIYVMDKTVVNYIPNNTKFDFAKDLFPAITDKISTFKSDCYWSDIGTLSSYYLTNNDVVLNAKHFGFSI